MKNNYFTDDDNSTSYSDIEDNKETITDKREKMLTEACQKVKEADLKYIKAIHSGDHKEINRAVLDQAIANIDLIIARGH